MSGEQVVAQGLDGERQALYVALYNERFDLAALCRESTQRLLLTDDDRRMQLARVRVLSEATDGEA